jgi:ProP effector
MKTASNTTTASPVRVLLKSLQDNFPVFRSCVPLAIGIDKEILVRLPETDRKLLRAALGMHTKSSSYLRQMEKVSVRVNLDGNTVGEVTELQRKHAAGLLQERARKVKELQAAQRELERKAKQEAEQAEAARKQTEKLNQLVSKFSRT